MRLATLASLLALAGCSGVSDPESDSGRYLHDRAFRRARLEQSLTNPHNGYSRLRLDHYARPGPTREVIDWDALPEWNPPVATVEPGGAMRQDEAALVLPDAVDDGSLRQLGEAAFFRYPAQLAAYATPALVTPESLDTFGLWRDPERGAGGMVSARFVDGGRGVALSCSTCHARIEGGQLVAGLPNQALDLSSLAATAAAGTTHPIPGIWGPGRVDVAVPGGEEPVRIPDLRPVAWLTHLHADGTVRNDPVALAIRIETLIITSHGAVIRPPRMVALALAVYLASLRPPVPPDPSDGGPESRGATLFSERCARCHVPPGLSGPPVPVAEIGTDARVGLSPDRGTGGYRAPSLRGVSSRGRLLHDGAVDTLHDLLDPARLARPQPVAGHAFGLDLGDADREALLAWLAWQ